MRYSLDDAVRVFNSGDKKFGLEILDRLLAKSKDDPYILHLVAQVLGDSGLYGIAINLYNRSLQLAPNAPWSLDAWENLGVCLKRSEHIENAKSCIKFALPRGLARTWGNYSSCFVNQGEPEKCIEICDEGLLKYPQDERLRLHKAIANFELGNYSDWAEYDTRIDLFKIRRKYECPVWDGSRVSKLVIHGEQGVGDEIMFSSLVNRAKSKVDSVVIECHQKLVEVFGRSFKVPCYVDDVSVMKSETTDAHIAVGSLPRYLALPDGKPYLVSDKTKVDRWREKYPGFRVGISWQGGSATTNEAYRNPELLLWKSLLSRGDNVRFLSVQYDGFRGDGEKIGVEQPQFVDFDDHMALVKSCALVISVCNTTVHMAGSMGVPCWCLVPSKPAWRYGLRGEKMMWYDSVKLYRQKDAWEDVMGEIVTDFVDKYTCR